MPSSKRHAQASGSLVFVLPLKRTLFSTGPLRTVTTLVLAGVALLLSGCGPAPILNRTVDVTPVPVPAESTVPGHSAGLDLHFLDATFGITCATDSVGDSSRGTAALMCSWKTRLG